MLWMGLFNGVSFDDGDVPGHDLDGVAQAHVPRAVFSMDRNQAHYLGRVGSLDGLGRVVEQTNHLVSGVVGTGP